VDPGARPPGGEDPDRDGEDDRDDQGGDGESDSGRQPLTDQPGDRAVGEDRRAAVALEEPADPGAELDEERPVEAELVVDAGDVLGRRVVTGDDGGGITRRDVEEREDEQGHHPHHGDGGQEPAEEVDGHADRAPSRPFIDSSMPDPLQGSAARTAASLAQALVTLSMAANGPSRFTR